VDLTIYEVAKVVGALNDVRKYANVELAGVEFDTRKIKCGDLFVPLKGRRDGHDFAESAVKNGASALFWARNLASAPNNVVVIHVSDAFVAMQKLASFYLQKINPLTVAVTGSNGKTTTKDFIFSVVSATKKAFKTPGNYNNEIGVPYTILSTPEDVQVLILEMGMDHPGDLHLLSKIVKSDLAVITLIGESHLEFFGTRDRLALAKLEIAESLSENGELLIPSEPLLEKYVEKLPQKIIKFGLKEENTKIYAEVTREEKAATYFTTNFLKTEFMIPVIGSYNVKNALVAVYIGKRLGVAAELIKKSLKKAELTSGRSEWLRRSDGLEILSDVYNANPTALGLVLAAFSKISTKGRKIAVLGDMLELGESSCELHQGLSKHFKPDKIQKIFLYGEEMRSLAEALRKIYPLNNVNHYQRNEGKDEKNKLIEDLKKEVRSDDVIVVKGSNSLELYEVVENLLAHKAKK